MGIEVREFKDGRYLIWDGYNCEAVNWESLFLDEKDISHLTATGVVQKAIQDLLKETN